jgi:hypothetical protein
MKIVLITGIKTYNENSKRRFVEVSCGLADNFY